MNAAGIIAWMESLATDRRFIAVAGTASIFSLLITLLILRKLLRINSQLVLNARQTKWLRSLQRHTTQISRSLESEAAAGDDIREILAKCRPTLRALNKCLPIWSSDRLQIVMLLSKIGRHLGDGTLRWLSMFRSRERFPRQIYVRLLKLNETLKEDIEQAKIYRARV